MWDTTTHLPLLNATEFYIFPDTTAIWSLEMFTQINPENKLIQPCNDRLVPSLITMKHSPHCLGEQKEDSNKLKSETTCQLFPLPLPTLALFMSSLWMRQIHDLPWTSNAEMFKHVRKNPGPRNMLLTSTESGIKSQIMLRICQNGSTVTAPSQPVSWSPTLNMEINQNISLSFVPFTSLY